MRDFERTINVTKYLPPVSRDSKDIQEITIAENAQLQALWDELCVILSNQFIRYLSVYGVEEWESTLGITKLDSQSLEERIQVILKKLSGHRPYTLRSFKRILKNIFGDGVIDIKLIGNKFEFWVTIEPQISYRVNELRDYIDHIIPLNLLIFIQELRQSSTNQYQGCSARIVQILRAKGGTIDFTPVSSNEYQGAYARIISTHRTEGV